MRSEKKSEMRNRIDKLEKLLVKRRDTKWRKKREFKKVRKISEIVFVIFIITINSTIKYTQLGENKEKYCRYRANGAEKRV
jgi:hypothetical protein